MGRPSRSGSRCRARFCRALAAFLALVPAAWAEIPVQEALGLSAGTDPKRPQLSPLRGLWALKSGVLAHVRFFGAYGPTPRPAFPAHPSLLARTGDDHPQDATAAVVQYLFPSPDGENFVFNQRAKDPIGEIALEQAGCRHGTPPNAGLGKVRDLLHAITRYRAHLAEASATLPSTEPDPSPALAPPAGPDPAALDLRVQVDHILAQARGGGGGRAAESRRTFAREARLRAPGTSSRRISGTRT